LFRRKAQKRADHAYFAELFEQYKNLVFKTALLMLDNAEQAEEALQEVFILVYRSLHLYDPRKGALTTWLYRITINYCLGQHRKQRLDCLPLEEEQLPENCPPVELNGSAFAEREAMLQAIHQLGEKLQVVVILRYYWELPYAEIAEILEIPNGTVKSRIDLAIRSLRKIVTAQAEAADRS